MDEVAPVPFLPPEGVDAAYAVFPKARRTVATDGTTLAWTLLPAADGVAPRTPVVTASGWSCSDAYWAHIAPALTALGHPVLLMDTRGHGASGLPRHPGRGARDLRPEDIAIARIADDLWEVADAAGIDEAVLMGHSMGVQVTLEAARRAPGRVAGLVLIAGSYENPLKTFWGLPVADVAFPFAKLAAASTPAPLLRLAMQPARLTAFGAWAAKVARATGPKARPTDMAPYLLHIAAADMAVMIRLIDAMRRHSSAGHLRKVRAPTLILAAERDTFTPPRCSRHMFERIPTAEIQWFADAGHTLPIEEPEAIVDHIDEWYGRRVAPEAVASR
ncbi:alpha/beta hydrolase [Iamia sp. SCSIO 61187]|uniref:alpha/beta fold hydrolase n=1 Tax=Iamia sp. SCSIO 61187 TaxID=2722752 RepID=UPI001C62F369|nr:alpha/beta hydrolase [Iamia sp. SCSIO 61187]QYG91347.1 alpha/beta hydrolase [Iamia sp. SCSIO 61187]